MNLKSLRARMTSSVTVFFAAWMLLVCVGLMTYEHHKTAQGVDLLLSTMAETFRRDLRESSDSGKNDLSSDKKPEQDFFDEHREDLIANNLALTIVDSSGRILQRSGDDSPPWPPSLNSGWRTATVAVNDLTFVLGFHWSKTEEALHQQALLLLALSFCVVLAAAFGTWVLVGRTLLPISRLSRQALEASTDSLRLRLTAPSQDSEIIELVSTLNDLLSRLADTARAKGRFYAAASHELRTPLQALSGHLEIALTRERSAEDYRDAIVEASTQTRRLISLVQDLLLLNQLDATSIPPMPTAVSVADIVDRTISSLQTIIQQRGLDVQITTLAEDEILAPPMHVEMMVRNIIENAVKYATPDGLVRIALEHEKRGFTFTVFNTFPSEPRLDVSNLFEPFYRREIPYVTINRGNGLGLAICKAIMLVNGWEIDFQQGKDGITVTTVFQRPSL